MQKLPKGWYLNRFQYLTAGLVKMIIFKIERPAGKGYVDLLLASLVSLFHILLRE